MLACGQRSPLFWPFFVFLHCHCVFWQQGSFTGRRGTGLRAVLCIILSDQGCLPSREVYLWAEPAQPLFTCALWLAAASLEKYTKLTDESTDSTDAAAYVYRHCIPSHPPPLLSPRQENLWCCMYPTLSFHFVHLKCLHIVSKFHFSYPRDVLFRLQSCQAWRALLLLHDKKRHFHYHQSQLLLTAAHLKGKTFAIFKEALDCVIKA